MKKLSWDTWWANVKLRSYSTRRDILRRRWASLPSQWKCWLDLARCVPHKGNEYADVVRLPQVPDPTAATAYNDDLS